jgi:hypothetical protein
MPVTPLVRKTLLADAAVSGAAAVLMITGAGLLGPLLSIPKSLLFWAGLLLVPFVAMLLIVARRETAHRMILLDIVLLNVLWVVASFAVILLGVVEPNALGIAFIAAQALAVALFAALQVGALKAASTAVS